MDRGCIYAIAAASGTGKTSLVKVLAESLDNIVTSISHTTRDARPDERHGENYYFISRTEFEQMLAKGEFLEHAEVFGNYYGTSRSWVEEQINRGSDVILEIDWQGARQVKKLFSNSVGIFILPPSLQELQRRLLNRNQDDSSVIARRLALASDEIAHCVEFDYIVINDKFDIALVDLRSIIRTQHLVKDVQIIKQQKLLAELVGTR